MANLPHVVEDLGGVIQLLSDGSTRRIEITEPCDDVKDDGSVVWKDYCFDKQHNLHLRIYKPKSDATKLPVIYYIHGGGFCAWTFERPMYHNCCLRISSSLNAIVVAPNYRLAPEHRLPAAIDDSFNALKWLQVLAKGGDLEKETDMRVGHDVVDSFDFDHFYIFGDSSGGNIAHHLAVRLGPGSPELMPIKTRGYVMFSPFFGGTERTKSEADGLPEKVLNMDILDTFWGMALPIGKTTDHPFANPFGPESPNLEQVKLDPMLIMVGKGELMKDRVKLYAKRLEELQKIAHYVEFEGKQHGMYFTHEAYSDAADSTLMLIKDFLFKHSSLGI